MGYEGLAITDDLEMGAISTMVPVEEGAVRAFAAGADLLLICKDPENLARSMDLLEKRVRDSEIPEGRLQASLLRIGRMKRRYLARVEPFSAARIRDYFRNSAIQ